MSHFERKEIYSINEVLDFLPNPEDYPKGFPLKKITKNYDGDLMKMGSQRYYVFKESLECAHCGIKGQFFAKERHVKKDGSPLHDSFHFNLYAIDDNGKEVLMTKDHVIPKSKGGANYFTNYVTMCSPCNGNKGSKDESEAITSFNKRDK